MDAHSCGKYGPDVQHALFLVWHAANRICAKRLIPFLPTLVEALERHEHLHLTEECRRQLLSMSAATADRLLRSQRKGGQRGPSTTRAGTLLKQQIPVRTFEEWSETRPVFLEADLVAHGGVDIEGGYLYILTLTDIATGWTAHYVTRNRTHGSVSPPFSLRMTGPKHRWPKLRVCASGNGRRLFLAVARVRFLMKPPFFLLAVCWCDHVATTPI